MKNGDSVVLTQEFWQSMSDEEWAEMFATGVITGAVAERAWHFAGRPGKKPRRLTVFLDRQDIERLIAEMPRPHHA